MQLLRSPSSRSVEHICSGLTVGLLILSWFACYLWIMGLTEGWGAPWDVAPVRPPTGHWQRTVNDFFESGIGSILPTAIFLISQGVLYLHTVIRVKEVRSPSLVFGLTNLLAMISLLIVAILMQTFLIRTPAHLTPEEWSYWGDFRREWPLSVVALGLYVGLLWIQPRMTDRFATSKVRKEDTF